MHSILRPNKETGSIGYISHSSQLWSVILGHVLRIRIIPSILKRGLRRIHSYSNGLIITSGNIGPAGLTLLRKRYCTGLARYHTSPLDTRSAIVNWEGLIVDGNSTRVVGS